jgi:hypothetical protein
MSGCVIYCGNLPLDVRERELEAGPGTPSRHCLRRSATVHRRLLPPCRPGPDAASPDCSASASPFLLNCQPAQPQFKRSCRQSAEDGTIGQAMEEDAASVYEYTDMS